MRRLIKKFLLVALISTFCFITGCGNNATKQANGPITIKLGCWDGEDSQKNFIKMSEGNGVGTLEIMSYPTSNDFWSKIGSQAAAGTAPDIALVTNDKIYEYVSRGLVAEIDTSKVDLSNLNKMALEAWTIDGKLYGYPMEIEPNCLVINMNVWTEAGLTEKDFPKTWDDVERLSAVVKEKCKDAYGFCFYAEDPFHITNLVNCFEGGWGYGETIDSDANAEAIDWLIKMFNEGYACTPAQLGYTWDGEVMVANKAAMTTGGVWYYNTMASANMQDQYRVVTLPTKDENTGTSVIHSGAFVIINGTQNYDAALQMVSYLARPEAQEMRSALVGNIPSDKTIRAEFYDSHETLKPLEGAEEGTNPSAYPIESEKFTSNLINNLTKVLYDEKDMGITGKDILKKVIEADDYK